MPYTVDLNRIKGKDMKLLLETLLANAERVLNVALSLDEQTQQALSELNHKNIALSLPTLSETLYFQIEHQTVFLSLRPPKTVDLKIHAPLKDLWSLAQKVQTPTQQVQISGNMHLAQRLGQIIQGFSPDWEEAVTDVLGDVAGHALAQLLRRAQRYAQTIAQALLQNSADYLVDEQMLIAPKASIAKFSDNVAHLRTQCDRLAVRINLLKLRVSP